MRVRQIGSFPQGFGVKIKNIWSHNLEHDFFVYCSSLGGFKNLTKKWWIPTNLHVHRNGFICEAPEMSKNASWAPSANLTFTTPKKLPPGSLTASFHLKMDGWNTIRTFLLGVFRPIFRCYVSFRECNMFPPTKGSSSFYFDKYFGGRQSWGCWLFVMYDLDTI